MSVLIFALTSFFTVPSWSFQDISLKDLSWTQERPWKTLLHYRPRPFSLGEESTVDGGDFFFAENGNRDPKAEAIAFSKALQENKVVGKLKQTAYCGFPERTRFLIEKTKLQLSTEVLNQDCQLYKTYIKKFSDPQKASLVFSSAYPNNPASMFGHTLLKIHSRRNSDLLDIGLSYAAVVSDDENPFAFFWFGVSGGYPGQWSIEPYYVKVQDYTNFESRDLWEYEVNLTPEEVRRLIDHVWELETNSFSDYFFFDENCSYQILAAIEAVKPQWNLLKSVYLYVIPGESIKFLAEVPESILSVNYRPSLFRKANANYNLIPLGERARYDDVLKKKSEVDLKDLSVASLETLLIELDFKRNQDKKLDRQWTEFEKSVRIERAGRGIVKSSIDLSEKATPPHRLNRPDLGNDSYSLQAAMGFRNIQLVDSKSEQEVSYLSLKIKTAYHDLLNSDAGYSQFSEIDFPWLKVSVDSKKKFHVNELGVLQTISLSPVTHFSTPVSYKAKLAIEKFDYFDTQFYFLSGGAGFGLSYSLSPEDDRLFGLLTFDTEIASDYKGGYRFLPGVEIGYLKDFSNAYKLQLLAKLNCNIAHTSHCLVESGFEANQSFFLRRNHEIRNLNSYRRLYFKQEISEFIFSLNYVYFFN